MAAEPLPPNPPGRQYQPPGSSGLIRGVIAVVALFCLAGGCFAAYGGVAAAPKRVSATSTPSRGRSTRIVVTATPRPARTPTPVSLWGVAVGTRAKVVAPDGLNVRTGPGLGYGEVVKPNLRYGTVVDIVGGPARGDGYYWWKVRLRNGKQGWCAANWLNPF